MLFLLFRHQLVQLLARVALLGELMLELLHLLLHLRCQHFRHVLPQEMDINLIIARPAQRDYRLNCLNQILQLTRTLHQVLHSLYLLPHYLPPLLGQLNLREWHDEFHLLRPFEQQFDEEAVDELDEAAARVVQPGYVGDDYVRFFEFLEFGQERLGLCRVPDPELHVLLVSFVYHLDHLLLRGFHDPLLFFLDSDFLFNICLE